MPTDLGRSFPIDWAGDPPHMLPPDVPVWYRFLHKWGFQFINLYYDCLLGGPVLTDLEKKDPLKRMWRTNLAKRADAIAELENELWIIEVSADPNLRYLGQLQTYRALWLRDPLISKIERLVLVSERVDPDVLDAAGMYGVLVFIV